MLFRIAGSVAVFVTLASQIWAQAAPTVTVVGRINHTITGQPILVPDNPDVILSIAEFPPGAKLAEHKHIYPHLAYVMQGVLTVTNRETGESYVVRQGDFVAEMQNVWHSGMNKGSVPVKLLIIDTVPHGLPDNVERPAQ
ncbi:MAG TPA: cupin domain-containing protein [Rhizomicrobium sp.]